MFSKCTTNEEIRKEKRDNFYRNTSRELFTGVRLTFEPAAASVWPCERKGNLDLIGPISSPSKDNSTKLSTGDKNLTVEPAEVSM